MTWSMFTASLASAQQTPATVTGQPSTQQPVPQQPSPQQPSPQQPSTQQPSPQQPFPQQPSDGQGQRDSMRLRCQAENGTVPYWLDNTCRSYLSCTSYNLSMKTCDEGWAYRYGVVSKLLAVDGGFKVCCVGIDLTRSARACVCVFVCVCVCVRTCVRT